MFVPRRYDHFVFGTIQSGVTSGVAAGVASFGYEQEEILLHWAQSWFLSWLIMIPLVLFAAPAIRRLTVLLTREDM
ncbi:MAG: DUF2798 domain-containing protein [Hyphomicrobiaceae bacterium]|jgi:hypothetical protein